MQFEKPVIDGEELAASLLYSNYKGLIYLFSIGTASGSTRHYSHKRTIVTCDLSGTSGTLIFAYPRNRTILIVANRLLVTISDYRQLLVTDNVTDRLSNPDYMISEPMRSIAPTQPVAEQLILHNL